MSDIVRPYWYDDIKISNAQWGLTDEQWESGLLGTHDVARILRVVPGTVARYCRDGIIEARRAFCRNPKHGAWTMTPKSIDAALKKYNYPV